MKMTQRQTAIAIGALLVALIFLVYSQTLHFSFVNYDDDENIKETPQVTAGVSWRGIAWAFTHTQVRRWAPLTTISRQIDCQMYGLRAGGHHFTNIVLHAAASVILLMALLELTGSLWSSAFVAAVFALHPLHVECVAWVSARGELLCGLFFILTLWSYSIYGRHPERRWQYAASLLWFALGLMSKPTIVTLPFVLLLLDYWPLRRFTSVSISRLILEKTPFFLLSVGACVIASIVNIRLDAVNRIPLWPRIQNAILSYGIYLQQTFWPAGLAAFYPQPESALSTLKIAAVLALLCIVTMLALRARARIPGLLVGWFWFLGMLVPVLGFVQISAYAHADRYTYLPQIGLCLALACLAGNWSGEMRGRRKALWTTAKMALCLLAILTYHQASYWRDSETLWRHTLECTPANAFAHDNLGTALIQKGRIDEAATQYEAAVGIDPNFASAHYNVGNILLHRGRLQEAEDQYREALRLKPEFGSAHCNLGIALYRQGEIDEAIAQYREAQRINPGNAEAFYNMGTALLKQGDVNGGIDQYRESLRIKPNNAAAQIDLARLLFKQGMDAEAIDHARQALDLQPSNLTTQTTLAWMLATAPQTSVRNGSRALELASAANQATDGGDPSVLRALAAAYAETGDFSRAAATARRALTLAATEPGSPLLAPLRHDIQLYDAGQKYVGGH